MAKLDLSESPKPPKEKKRKLSGMSNTSEQKKQKKGKNKKVSSISESELQNDDLTQNTSEVELSSSKKSKKRQNSDSKSPKIFKSVKKLKTKLMKSTNNDSTISQDSESDTNLQVSTETKVSKLTIEEAMEKYPVLKDEELVKKYLAVPINNTKKRRIRQGLRNFFRGDGGPEPINRKLTAILNQSPLTENDLKEAGILHKMLRDAVQGLAEKGGPAKKPNKKEKKNSKKTEDSETESDAKPEAEEEMAELSPKPSKDKKQKKRKQDKNKKVSSINESELQNDDLTQNTSEVELSSSKKMKKRKHSDSEPPKISTSVKKLKTKSAKNTNNDSTLSQESESDTNLQVSTERNVSKLTFDEAMEKYPVLKDKELVKKFLAVPLTNGQKGRIREVLRDSLRRTSSERDPELINKKLAARLNRELTDSNLKRVRILHNMLRAAVHGLAKKGKPMKKKKKSQNTEDTGSEAEAKPETEEEGKRAKSSASRKRSIRRKKRRAVEAARAQAKEGQE